jgi:hypothetical protein
MAVHFRNDELLIGTWDCFLINIWRGNHRPSYAEERGKAGWILARTSPGPLALFTLVLDTASLPDDPTRDALAHARLEPCFERVVACAGVAEGDPLRAAALRAVSIDLDQRAPPPFPTKMFGDRSDAVLWMLDRLTAAGKPGIRGRALLSVIAAAI